MHKSVHTHIHIPLYEQSRHCPKQPNLQFWIQLNCLESGGVDYNQSNSQDSVMLRYHKDPKDFATGLSGSTAGVSRWQPF